MWGGKYHLHFTHHVEQYTIATTLTINDRSESFTLDISKEATPFLLCKLVVVAKNCADIYFFNTI